MRASDVVSTKAGLPCLNFGISHQKLARTLLAECSLSSGRRAILCLWVAWEKYEV